MLGLLNVLIGDIQSGIGVPDDKPIVVLLEAFKLNGIRCEDVISIMYVLL